MLSLQKSSSLLQNKSHPTSLFTGRYIEIHVFPFSFQEYCQYYNDIRDKDKLFDDYSIKGGLVGSYVYRTEKDRTNYIKEVYETIVTGDLVQKYALPDILVLQRLSRFFMDNISNLTLPDKVSQLLTTNKTPTNHVTVVRCIKYLCNEFLFYDMIFVGRNTLEASKSFTCVTATFDMRYLEAETWTMEESMKSSFVSNCSAVGMMFMPISSIKKR